MELIKIITMSIIGLILFSGCDVQVATDYCHSKDYNNYHLKFNDDSENELLQCYNTKRDYINISKPMDEIRKELYED